MNNSKRVISRVLGCLLLIGLSGNIYGAQPAESLEYAGLTHHALGDALLEIVEERLIVSNIGEGGFDGVLIELAGATEFGMEWANFSSFNIPANASMQFGARSTLADENSSTYFSFLIAQGLFLERNGLNLLEIAPNFSQTEDIEYRFEVYSRGNEVAVGASTNPQVFARVMSNNYAPFPTGVRLITDENGVLGYALTWLKLNEVLQIIFPFRDNALFVADELRIFPANGSVESLESLTELNIWLGDIPELRITDEASVR